MVIQQVFSIAPSAPAQLGAVDLSLPLAAGKALSVKGYAQGWASYQSPAANEILKEINTGLLSLGFEIRYDGVIDARSVNAVKLLASIMGSPGYAGIPLVGGGTAGYAATILRRFSTMEALAKGGVEARYYIRALAQTQATSNIVRAINAGRQPPAVAAATATPTATTPQPIAPPAPSSGTSTFPTAPMPYDATAPGAKPRWPYAVAGGILLLGLGAATYFVWR